MASAEYLREYRARRKAEGNPVPRGKRRPAKQDSHEWIAFDGEGADDSAGHHRYILAVCHHSSGDQVHLEAPDGLAPAAVLDMMVQFGQVHPNAIWVVFSGGYDAVMLLRNLLTEGELRELWQRAHLAHPDGKRMLVSNNWIIGFQPGRQLYIYSKARRSAVTLWDVWGFYQASFVRTLSAWLADDPDLTMIANQKLRRGEFDPAELPDLLRYCTAECRLLCRLMERLHGYLESAGLRLNRWDGAGAIAGALLKANGVGSHLRETPPDMTDIVSRAYFGGRAECVRYGHHSTTVYQYDLISAYPAALVDLSSWSGTAWQRVGPTEPETIESHPYALVRVVWEYDDVPGVLYPFPYRLPGGQVCYPPRGEAWVWSCELAAALDHPPTPIGQVEVQDAYVLTHCGPPGAWSFVADLFARRQELKKAGDPAQIVYKLGLNSLYGKLAQQVGGSTERTPPYFQLELAGLITARVRAHMYRLAQRNPASVICIATDGLYSTTPLLTADDQRDGLGGWEETLHGCMTIVQSGVYWLRTQERVIAHTRGYSQDAADMATGISEQRVLDAWKAAKKTKTITLDIQNRRRFVTLGQTVTGQVGWSKLGCWIPEYKQLALYPASKRVPLQGALTRGAPWQRLESTHALDLGPAPGLSSPFPVLWWTGDPTRLDARLYAADANTVE